jgi:hypothetical protein
MTKSRLAVLTTLLMLALAAALGMAAVVVEKARAADSTSVDDGGFSVRVVEEGAKGKTKGRTAPKPPDTPDVPKGPDTPDAPDAPNAPDLDFDFNHSNANDLVRFGEDIEIPEGKVVEGDVVAVGGDITVYGRVRGDAVAVGGAVRVKGGGAVEGDAVSLGGGVSTADSASVGGSNVSIGKWDFGGHGWSTLPALGMFGALGIGMWFFTTILKVLISLFFAWIALLFLRDRILRAGEVLAQQFGRSFLMGLLAWAGLVLAVPVGIVTLVVAGAIAIVILCVTIIGIPLALLLVVALVLSIIGLLVAVVLAAFLGYVNGAMYLGRRVLGSRFGASTKPLVAILGGLLTVALIRGVGEVLGTLGFFLVHPFSIAFAIAAGALAFILTTAGLGAFVVSRFGTGPRGSFTGTYNWGPAFVDVKLGTSAPPSAGSSPPPPTGPSPPPPPPAGPAAPPPPETFG